MISCTASLISEVALLCWRAAAERGGQRARRVGRRLQCRDRDTTKPIIESSSYFSCSSLRPQQQKHGCAAQQRPPAAPPHQVRMPTCARSCDRDHGPPCSIRRWDGGPPAHLPTRPPCPQGRCAAPAARLAGCDPWAQGAGAGGRVCGAAGPGGRCADAQGARRGGVSVPSNGRRGVSGCL